MHFASTRPGVRRSVLVAVTATLALASSIALVSPSGAVERPTPAICLSQLDVTDLGPDGAYGMAIDPVDDKVYVAVDGQSEIRVLDPFTNDVVNTIPVPNGAGQSSVGFLAIDHADDTLYVSSFSDGKVFAIDISSETKVGEIPVVQPQAVAINNSTHRLYVAGQTNNVTVVDTVSNTAVGSLPVGGHSQTVTLDPATNRIFVPDFTNGTLDVFNGVTNAFIDSHDLPGPVGNEPLTAQWDPEAGHVWVTTRSPGRVEEVDPDTGAIGVSFAFGGAQGFAINPSIGQGYVSPSNGTTLRAFSLADGHTIDTFAVGTDPLVAVSKVDPVRVYVAAIDDGTVTVIGTGAGPFPDVPGSSQFCDDIAWLTDEGVTTGFPNGTYRPVASVTRQSMAAFLYRFAGEPAYVPPGIPSFSDVPLSHPFFKEIEWLADEEVTGGFVDGTFRPTSQITRQAMAAFLYRTANHGSPAPICAAAAFPDVPLSHPFCGYIDWLDDNGVTGGFADGTFRPAANVTRQAMAAFLHRFSLLA